MNGATPAHAPMLLRHGYGVVGLAGRDALTLLHRLATQHMLSMPCGSAPPAGAPSFVAGPCHGRPTLFVNHQGRLVARALAVASPTSVTLLTRQGGACELVAWLERYTISEDATFSVLSESATCLRALAAPPTATAAPAAAPSLAAMWPSLEQALLTAGASFWPAPRGWGEGIDIVVPPAAEPTLLAALERLGFASQQSEADFACMQLLVGEPGFALEQLALAAPLEWRLGQDAIDWHKGCFVGQEVLSRLDSYNKVARLTMGLEAGGEALQHLQRGASAKIIRESEAIGKLAHFAARPAAAGGAASTIGLAMVRKLAASPGNCSLQLSSAEGEVVHLSATLVDRPYWLAG